MVRTMTNSKAFEIEKTAEQIYNDSMSFGPSISPKHEMLFYALERLAVDAPSPVMLFFYIVSRAKAEKVGNMSNVLGSSRYSEMRNRNQANVKSKYWFLQFRQKGKIDKSFILAKKKEIDDLVQMDYDLSEELDKAGDKIGDEETSGYNIADIVYIYSADKRVRKDGKNDVLFPELPSAAVVVDALTGSTYTYHFLRSPHRQ